MNKLKEKLVELKDYLGRDQKGLKLLAEVTLLANQQRKELAVEKGKEPTRQELVTEAKEKLQSALHTIEDLKAEAVRNEAIRKQQEITMAGLRAEVTELYREIDKLMPEEMPILERTERVSGFPTHELHSRLTEDLRHVTDLFNTLRKDMKCAPKAIPIKEVEVVAHELNDIVKDLSSPSMLRLGRYVALQALFDMPCIIQTWVSVFDAKGNRRVPEGALGSYYRWLRHQFRDRGYEMCPVNERPTTFPGQQAVISQFIPNRR